MNDPVKAKIIELVPEIQTQVCFLPHDGKPNEGCFETRPITLADVLRSMPGYAPGEPIVGVDHEGTFLEWRDKAFRYFKDIPQWNLTTDYDGQTQEVKDFIGKLLGV